MSTTPAHKPSASLGDFLPTPTSPPASSAREEIPALVGGEPERDNLPRLESEDDRPIRQNEAPSPPGDLIAFSFFNPAPHRQVYETHLINPDGTDHRLFPLDGVSEPALRRTAEGHLMTYRAWSEPTSPRSLLSSNLDGFSPRPIGGFWEDAQPDWSPTENRIIFASQRESDRHWRLYTIWGDGSAEKNLQREGRSPSFAPEGYRFVFEGCDQTGNRCGLWTGTLDDSEHGSRPLLEDPQARSPDWSPVGEQIVYMANPNDNWDLYLINTDDPGNVRRLTTNPAIDGLPAWSPDGEWLAFLSDRGGNWGVWLLHVAGGELHRIFNFDGGIFSPPNRPPYGERYWWDEQLSWSR
jgi:dipeptidyl aminopeptidase/acylaminoacyl peptidase